MLFRVRAHVFELIIYIVLQIIFLSMGKIMTSIWISVGFGIASLLQLRFNKPTQNKMKFKNATSSILPESDIQSRRSVTFSDLDEEVNKMMNELGR